MSTEVNANVIKRNGVEVIFDKAKIINAVEKANEDNRIRGIIASLSQGYPMGAIMRLQYGNPDIQFKYRTITGVKGVSVKPEHLILDGQQRLTSIYQATSSK